VPSREYAFSFISYYFEKEGKDVLMIDFKDFFEHERVKIIEIFSLLFPNQM
jgi:hypothetical protein